MDVTPETVEMSDEATALVPLQPLAPPRFRRSPIPVTAHKGRGHGSGLENATQNTSTQEGQAGTMQGECLLAPLYGKFERSVSCLLVFELSLPTLVY